MEVYRLRVWPKGAWSPKQRDVTIHDPASVAEITVAAALVLGRPVKSGDEIELLKGSKTVMRRFTVT